MQAVIHVEFTGTDDERRKASLDFFPQGLPNLGDKCVFVCTGASIEDGREVYSFGLVPARLGPAFFGEEPLPIRSFGKPKEDPTSR